MRKMLFCRIATPLPVELTSPFCKTSMKNPLGNPCFLSLVGAIVLGAGHISAAPLLEYNFNGTGTTAANTGSLSGGTLTFLDTAGSAADLHSASGQGVSGLPGDMAFDNTASTGMGSAGTGGGKAQSAGNFTNMGTVQSFTIQGWYKADAIGGGAKLFELTGGGVITLATNAANRLSLTVNSIFSQSAASTVYDDSGSWVFFGVTYDGTLTSNNVKFYAGTLDSAVSLVNSATLNQGARPVGFTSLAIGNSYGSDNRRPFDGLLDDFRFFDSTTGADGALGLAQLEELRLSAIPEPSSVILCLVGGLFLVVLAVKRRNAVSVNS